MAAIVSTRTAHEGWTKLVVATIEEDGREPYSREVEDHGNAAAVLPYDPERRVAMLVRLPRAPVLFAGFDGRLVEAPAGIMDEDDPEETVRREALEEVGLRLGALEPLGTFWASPGLSTERIALFLAHYSPGDRVAAGGGLAEENEAIEVLEVPLAELRRMVGAGEVADMKTVALMLFLKERHPELFA